MPEVNCVRAVPMLQGCHMFKVTRKVLIAGLLAVVAGPAMAADMVEPQVVEQEPAPAYEAPSYGGWYIRGDVDYHWSKTRGIQYTTYGAPGGYSEFDSYKLRAAPSLGLGIGYQIDNHFRVDLTGDYWFKANFRGSTSGTCGALPCTSTEVSKFSALLLLANAYADLGTYHGITPYVGAGIGGAHVKWGDFNDPNTTEFNPGHGSWRFAYALMAGASYCLTENWKLDAGYRFSHIEGGRAFDYDVTSAGPGYDKGINTHEVRGGLRYSFGGGSGCGEPVVAYTPEPQPVYTK